MNKIKRLIYNGDDFLVGYDKDGNITIQSPLERFMEGEAFKQIIEKFIEKDIADGKIKSKDDSPLNDLLQGKPKWEEIHKHCPQGGITVTGNFVSSTKTTAKIIPFRKKEQK